MNPWKLTIRNLQHYWKRNTLLALGFAISTAVLTGAFIVGDSVKYSLNRIVEQRLGNIQLIMQTGDRYFTEELTSSLRLDLNTPVSGVLMVDGIVVADGGQKRMNNVRVVGNDASFDQIAGIENFYGKLNGDSVIISKNLSQRLNLDVGDEFVLRMTRASLVPLNAPFVSEEDNIVSIRVSIAAIATNNELGAFNIQNSQTAPFNVFISASRLRDIMALGNRSNLLLLADNDIKRDELYARVRKYWSPEDAGLKFRLDEMSGFLDVKSDRVFIDSAVAKSLSEANETGNPYVTYFINTITSSGGTTPYSFVSSLPDNVLSDNEILINQWLADDLKAKAGDSVLLSYFVVGPLRELEVETATFRIKSVVPLAGQYNDKFLMPDIPGMSDAGNCRDWEAGVPISLESIRDKDEDYWTYYKGTPKAFISLSRARELWSNRFGTYTSFRYHADHCDVDHLKHLIMSRLDPLALGFEVRQVSSEGAYAAANGVDFSELFGGLSFFLLAGAIILSILLFRLNLEERKEQISTLAAMGIPFRKIRRVMINESSIVAIAGGLTGLLLSVFYNKLIFYALNSIWMDIVRTNMLEVDVKLITLLIGFLISIVIAWVILFTTISRYLNRLSRRHIQQNKRRRFLIGNLPFLLTGVLAGSVAVILILLQLAKNEGVNTGVFFPAGGLLLLSGLSFSYAYLLKLRVLNTKNFNLKSLSLKNALGNLPRSMSIIILLALGTFIVITTGSNKKDLFVKANEKTSGTGGFLFYAESTVPVLKNLNNTEVKYDFALSEGYDILQMRIAEGDDASCLNLNKISTPRILGVDHQKLSGRFSFVTSIPDLDKSDPWNTLSADLGGKVIPAIADETVIKWGLGKAVGDTLIYQDALGKEMKLLLVGGLAPSIFQGSVLIAMEPFLQHFPASSGTNVFLVDGEMADTAMIRNELNLGLRDLGWAMEYTAARLSEFNSITNTYLSIFMILGALGLLLGTVGLSIVLFRSILERIRELALLISVGYSRNRVKRLVSREYLWLLIAGTMVGGLSAIISILPSLISKNTDASAIMVIAIIALLILNGMIWIFWMTSVAIKNKSLNSALREE